MHSYLHCTRTVTLASRPWSLKFNSISTGNPACSLVDSFTAVMSGEMNAYIWVHISVQFLPFLIAVNPVLH